MFHLIALTAYSPDMHINKAAKEFLHKKFHKWYVKQVCSQLQQKVKTQPADLRLSIVKPMGAKWMCDLYDYLKSKPDIIHNGFIATGLLKL